MSIKKPEPANENIGGMNMRKCIAVAAVILLAAGLLAAGLLAFARRVPAQQTGKTYTYALWPTYGKNSKQMNDLVKHIITLLFKNMGEKVNVIEMSKQEAYAAAAKGKVDFVLLYQDDYVEMVNAKKNIHPVLTAAPRGHIREYRCLIVPKVSPAQSLKDMKGKVFPKPQNYSEYVSLRYDLKQNGVNMPLGSFFSGFVPAEGDFQAVQLVSEGKTDGAVVSLGTYNFVKFANGAITKKLNARDCHELPWPSAPIVWVGTPDQKSLKKLYDVLANVENIPEFKQLKPMLNVVQAQFYLVADKDYTQMVKIFNQGKKDGWATEFKKLTGK